MVMVVMFNNVSDGCDGLVIVIMKLILNILDMMDADE